MTDRHHGASPRDQAIQSLLRAADRGNTDEIAAILDVHPDIVSERGTLDGHTGLRTALHFGIHNEAVVRLLLERGADPNVRDEGDNAFPLHFAAEDGNLAIVRLLVEHGAQTTAGEVDDHHLDIIGWAICFSYVDHREVARYLLAHGARHTLFSAVAMGDVAAVRERARENPADLERPLDRVIRKRRALHLAILKKQPEALAALLELGADPDATDAIGMTPLDEAALRGAEGMTRMLLDAGATLTLAAAIALRRTTDVERLLKDDPDALKSGGRLGSLIVHAAEDGPAELIEALIRYGADVNVQASTETAVDGTLGYTALHAAAFHGNLAAIDVLLRHGANPRVRDSRYCGTPAGWANYARKPEAFERLLAAGPDIFDAIDFDRAAEIPAVLERDAAALHRRFGEYLPPGAESAPWCPDPHVTPLEWASREGKAHAVRILGSRGAEMMAGGHFASTDEDRAAALLRMACLDWAVGGPDRARHTHAAARLLERHPQLARHDFLTAVICGEADDVERRLSMDPALAQTGGGPRAWPPLLYLCGARFPRRGPWSDNARRIARMLLDAGADPNAFYPGGSPQIHYTALTCVAGRGEEQAAVHPEARPLATLLLERGAEPYDGQVFYNVFAGHASQRHLAQDDFVWLLDLIYDTSVARGRAADWQDPEWRMIDMGGYGHGAWYLLQCALQGNVPRIAEWALAHGATADPAPPNHPQTPPGSLYERALRAGQHDFVELLARHGASSSSPESQGRSAFAAACFRLDRDAARRLADAHPEYLLDPAPLLAAAERNRADVAALLLDLGMSPDAATPANLRPLHNAAYHGAADVARILLQRGAEVDPYNTEWGNTPIGGAAWGGRPDMVDLLAPLSRDVWTLVGAGKAARLREVLEKEPQRARATWEGQTPLFDLPDDEEAAAGIVRLFLRHGADPRARSREGVTAEQVARARGLTAAADLLRDAAG